MTLLSSVSLPGFVRAYGSTERTENSGFALLKGDNLEVYLKKYVIELGRRSKSTRLGVVLGERPGCQDISEKPSVGVEQATGPAVVSNLLL